MGNKRKWYSILLIGLVLLIASSFVGCAKPPVINQFDVSPTQISAGESATLEWNVTRATTVNIDHGIGDVPSAGKKLVSPAKTTTYTLTATNAASTATKSAALTVKPKPAAFTTSALSISPTEVNIGEEVTISAVVTNTGELAGSYPVTLKINNVAVETKSATLAGGASQKVTFTTSKDVVGAYAVNVNGLPGTFIVSPPNGTDIVHITKTGKKYHKAGCQYLSKSDIPIERSEAIKRGYTPCSRCRP